MIFWVFNKFREITEKLDLIIKLAKEIKVTQQELAVELTTVKGQMVKIGTEIGTLQTKITDLENTINNGGNVTQLVLDALAALKAQAQVVDDLVPDAPTP